MNEHEIERLAASMNAARPDWPLQSLRTFIRKNLSARPYRDAFVALAWVACEPNTATPARVLEAGPWWRAAAVEGATHVPKQPTSGNACWNCNKVYRLDLRDDGRTDTCCDNPSRRPEKGADPAPYVAQIRQEIRR